MKSTYDMFMKYFEKKGLDRERKDLVTQAKGHVLEIGVGTGINLSYYSEGVSSLELTDYKLNTSLLSKLEAYKIPYNVSEEDVMVLPFKDETFDTIVCTLVFCSVEDVDVGLKEIKRVLKPHGSYIFIEHVLPEDKMLRPLFNTLTPAWKKVASNCHLNREFTTSLEKVGFTYSLHNRFFKTAFISGTAKK